MSATPNQDFDRKYIPTVRWTSVSNLTTPVDQGFVTYQRDIGGFYKNGNTRINPRMRTRFRNKFGEIFKVDRWTPPHVARRLDGTLAVMDGNGRCHFAQLKNGGDYRVPYLEYEGLSLTDEIAFFNAQRYAKQLSYNDYRHANEQDVESREFADSQLIARYGFDIGRGKDRIAGGTLELIAQEDTPLEEVLRVMQVLRKAYPDDACVTNKAYMQALAKMLGNRRYAPASLEALLVSTAPEGVTPHGDGQGGASLWKQVKRNLDALYTEAFSG